MVWGTRSYTTSVHALTNRIQYAKRCCCSHEPLYSCVQQHLLTHYHRHHLFAAPRRRSPLLVAAARRCHLAAAAPRCRRSSLRLLVAAIHRCLVAADPRRRRCASPPLLVAGARRRRRNCRRQQAIVRGVGGRAARARARGGRIGIWGEATAGAVTDFPAARERGVLGGGRPSCAGPPARSCLRRPERGCPDKVSSVDYISL